MNYTKPVVYRETERGILQIDKVARRLGLSRSAFVRSLVRQAIQEHQGDGGKKRGAGDDEKRS